MLVFLPHKKANHTMHISPAADREFVKGEVPADWVDDENNPRQFTIEFTRGKAEVDDKIGKYLIDRGLAKKTKLIIPDED